MKQAGDFAVDVGKQAASATVDVGKTVVSGTVDLAGSGAKAVARGGFGIVQDLSLELRDLVIQQPDIPQDWIDAPTPDDRWFTPEDG